ncbi:hypothetical protein HBI64_117810 [Parastagonospora nodorum]|nr:hypothetical protein HBH49_069450 [Parastagonospora nodorum]KAH5025168.1 hypothetical protein HBI74_128110 [Parastagonospora nodorum]KAH5031960.1 hypothetical protein HBI75_112500 [Parastagonospora nodorum]KAH5543586.1 hypothetical protein HBI27_069070 [Parastagonospora nodorum]KAH6114367.1 hypothetical protein HBI69_123610 [Parastagonospora nodorum]
MASNRLIVAVDYGTTYTGVSYCETSSTGSHRNSEVIHDWPSRNTKIGTKEKVPSEVTYQPEGIVWGSLIAPNVQRHIWTKLYLDSRKSGEAAKILSEVTASPQKSRKKPVEIVADYLAQIKAHLIKNLDQKFGQTLWRSLPITLVVTVPAVWSDAAKARTIEAFDKAGFNSLEFTQSVRTIVATEPECAALHTIDTLRGSTQDTNFKVGDGFIVCDMGGGTVDLISYRVAGLRPTIIEESTIGIGDECGGTFVDRAFLEWLEKRLGTTDFLTIAGCRSEEVPRISLSRKAARMLQDFTLEVKSGFSGTETNYLRLPTPLSAIEDDEVRGISDGEIEIKPEDMESMFAKSICRTYELISQQLQQAKKSKKVNIKHVFMVGGFAESPYVYNKIKNFVEDHGLIAVKPSYAWSAVVRGAVIKGLEGGSNTAITVTKRKCRRYYGAGSCPVFNANKHLASEAFIDEYDGLTRASGQMDWLVKKGQDLPTSGAHHATLPFIVSFWPGEKRTCNLKLYAAECTKAPRCLKDKDVYAVATLSVDLSIVPKDEFKPLRSPIGALYHQLSYSIEISVQSSLEYSLSVAGKKYATLTATYE